jgi:hypothetical protein
MGIIELKMKSKLFPKWKIPVFISSSLAVIVLIFINIYSIWFGHDLPISLSWVGTVVWILTFVIMLLFSVNCFQRIIKISIKHQTFYTLFILCVFVGMVLFRASQPQNISGETTQATSCILNSSYLGEKLNENCFLGYPARMYLIQSLPSLVLGRNLLSLNLGAVLIFFPSLVIFAYSLLTETKSKRLLDLILGTSIALLFYFHYVNHFLFYSFEQSIFPLSFGLASLGLLVVYRKKQWSYVLPLFLITTFWMVFSYTPSLALLPLVGFYLLINRFSSIKQRMQWLILFLIVSVSSIVTTLQYRTDMRLNSTDITWQEKIVKAPAETIEILSYLVKPEALIPFVSPTIIIILFSLLFIGIIQKKYRIIPFLWVFITLYLATSAQGYAYYGLDFRVHRSLVILPVILMLAVQVSHRLLSNTHLSWPKQTRLVLITLFALTLFVGLENNSKFIDAKKPDDRQLLSLFVSNNLNVAREIPFYIVDAKPYQNLVSAPDFLVYFSPRFKVKLITTRECMISPSGLYLFGPDNECARVIMQDKRTVIWGQYLDTQGLEMLVLEKK